MGVVRRFRELDSIYSSTVATEVLSDCHVTFLSVAFSGKIVAIRLSVLSFSISAVCLFWKVNEGANATVDADGKVTLTKDAADGEKITVTATNIHGVTGTIDLTVKSEEQSISSLKIVCAEPPSPSVILFVNAVQ